MITHQPRTPAFSIPTFVRGTLLYGPKREPVPGIRIEARKSHVEIAHGVSDSEGRFEIRLHRGGVWWVVANPFGRETFRPRRRVEVGDGGEATVDILIPDRVTYHIRGRVREPNCRGIAGVKVQACHTVLGGEKRVKAETKSGSGGHYEITGFVIPVPRPSSPEADEGPLQGEKSCQDSSGKTVGTQFSRYIIIHLEHPDYSVKTDRVDLFRYPPRSVASVDTVLVKKIPEDSSEGD